jgi:crossover junction endodeoxyribonuclease RuvC
MARLRFELSMMSPTPTQAHSERVLAVDPSLRGTGYAVLERLKGAGARGETVLRALTWGAIRNSPSLLQSACLVAIHGRVHELVREFAPSAAAFESVIYVQSYKTAIVLGCARGAAMLAVAAGGIPIFEYAPRRVKQAVVGRGGAEKQRKPLSDPRGPDRGEKQPGGYPQ